MAAQGDKQLATPLALYVLAGAGILMIAVGVAWKHVIPPESFWSEEQSKAYDQAYFQAHEASIGPGHTHSHSDGHEHPTPLDLEEAKERFREAHQALEAARRARDLTGPILTGVGVVLALTGAVWLSRVQAG